MKDIQDLTRNEMETINGGNPAGVAAGIYVAVLAGAYYLGYKNAKDDCPPPPCKE